MSIESRRWLTEPSWSERWDGNSRPIFVRGRVLALLGYEIVEGDLKNGSMRELRRNKLCAAARGGYEGLTRHVTLRGKQLGPFVRD